MGRGIVHPVDVMANEPWSEDLLDYLAGYLVDHGYDLKTLIAHIVRSRAYQSQAVSRQEEASADDYVFRGPEVKRMTAEQFLDAVWMITRTAPAKGAVNVRPESIALEAAAPTSRFVRASLVNADLLMRSLGPAEPRAGRHDPRRRADHAAGPRPVQRPDPDRDAGARRGQPAR